MLDMQRQKGMLLDTANRDTLSDAPATEPLSELLLLCGTSALRGLLVSRARVLLNGRTRHELAGLGRLVHGLGHRNHLPSVRSNYGRVVLPQSLNCSQYAQAVRHQPNGVDKLSTKATGTRCARTHPNPCPIGCGDHRAGARIDAGRHAQVPGATEVPAPGTTPQGGTP